MALWADTASGPLKKIQGAVKNNVGPMLVSALQAAPAGANWYVQTVNSMVKAGAGDAADANQANTIVTAGASAAAAAAPLVSATWPYLAVGAGDLTLLNAVGEEWKAGTNGQCIW